MKNLTIFVLAFASCVLCIQITIFKNVPKFALNLTALHRVKNQLSKITNTIANINLKKKMAQNVVLDVHKLEFARQTRRKKSAAVAKDNLDDLYPALAIRSVNVNLDWVAFVETMVNGSSVIGSSLVLSDGKNLVSHVMKTSSAGNYYTIPSLQQDRVYKGEIKLVTEKEELKNFIKKKLNGGNIEEFELTTPFIVADTDVKNILETKLLLEAKEKQLPRTLKVNNIDIKITFSKIDKYGHTVELSRYHVIDRNASNWILSSPEQTVELLPPAKDVVISDLRPHELLRITLKNVVENDENGEIKFSTIYTTNIFTGSVYGKKIANFSRATTVVSEFRKANQSIGVNKFANYKNFHVVKCYIDDDVFNGYSCRNSEFCLPLDWVCDGEYDCKEKDDENYCTDRDNYDDNYNYVCRKYEFRCHARGESVCLPNSWLCDGRRDCADGWDEDDDNCYEEIKKMRPGYINHKIIYDKSCARNSFRCWSGKECVAIRDVCDGTEDCNDGSDERICENWSRSCDSRSEFRCYKASTSITSFVSRSCIPRSWVCDEQEDCLDGEDESSKICDNYNKFSFATNLLKPFGIDFEINGGFKNKK